jgi:formylglycine-generating enzyme required for sulfatase activity
LMGASPSEPPHETFMNVTEGPRHRVTISQPFAIGQYALTRAQFAKFVKETGYKTENGCLARLGRTLSHPSEFPFAQWWKNVEELSWRSPGYEQGDDHPVVCVSWNAATAFTSWLSSRTGKRYRLPSEAEFEYAARAGTSTAFWWGNSISTSQANYNGNYTYGGGTPGEFRKKTLPVKALQSNPWGLYQMHGNAWMWLADCWKTNYDDAPDNGSADTAGDCSQRAFRGGAWDAYPWDARSAMRLGGPPTSQFFNFGFRIARSLD